MIDKLQKQKDILEGMGYRVAYICVYGSQNYGLDVYTPEYTSDIDMKAVIIPSLDDLVKNSMPVSTSIDTEWGICDLKDIRVYIETLCKANPAYIETLYTNYYISTPIFDEIIKLRGELLKGLSARIIRASYGMMCEKEKALCHPYPSIKDKIDKYGYDPKQLHHIVRLFRFMERLISSGEYQMTEEGDSREELLSIKVQPKELNIALSMAGEYMKKGKELTDKYCQGKEDDYNVKYKIIELSHSIIKDSIIQNIK